ncbi:MAG: hydrogenase expression/formation protein HypE [Ignavibacteriae bacterium]|nr:MAG: hydrogenase expression/formation protein HypE [Ignavibacteriota bacterium]
MKNKEFILSCPVEIQKYPSVMMAHGGGGKLMHNLIEKMFMPEFSKIDAGKRHDSAVIDISSNKLAFTTDSYVIHPLFFPGGDIGSLAVHGTVNDLAMSGAVPKYISAGFIIEEGLPMETLWRIVNSMKETAKICGVEIITGDTKVVDKGKGDGIFINTSGIGVIEHNLSINPASIKEGDAIIINGDIGRHGIAIMAVREGLEFETVIESDSAPLNSIVNKLINEGIEIHCMRDLTRGGLSSALAEIAEASNFGININEKDIPVREDVRGACEILGLDPLYVANEGRFVLFVPEKDAAKALQLMQLEEPAVSMIGTVNTNNKGMVTMKSVIEASRIIDMLSGEQLPRIC